MNDADESPRTAAAEIHHSHRDVNGGALRASVFGAMDGLVSNAALITGVSGGGAPARAIVLTGLAGLAAGALSMAAGEYTSVAAQTELTKAEIETEREELTSRPHAELAELSALYIERGLDPDLAERVARALSADPRQALEIHAREELGVDPYDLPSPYVAAGSSFVAFSIGAFLPVLPYLLGAHNLLPAVLVTAVGLFLAGALVSRVTTRTWWYSGLRQLLLGGTAATVTYAFGALIGSGVG